MSMKRTLLRGAAILSLVHIVPLVACSDSSDEGSDKKDDDNIRQHNDCQVEVDCGVSQFTLSDSLAPGSYELSVVSDNEDIECSFEVNEEQRITGGCEEGDGISIDVEAIEVDWGSIDVDITLTDAGGCESSGSARASAHVDEVTGCDYICEGASVSVDVSGCAPVVQQNNPYCQEEIAEAPDWEEWCGASMPIDGLAVGCGYIELRSSEPYLQFDWIIDDETDELVYVTETHPQIDDVDDYACAAGTRPTCDDRTVYDDSNDDPDAIQRELSQICSRKVAGGIGGQGGGGQ